MATQAAHRVIGTLILGLFAGLATKASAATFLPVEDGALADRSSVVVVGQVRDVTGVDTSGRPAIDYQVTVEEAIFGTDAEELVVRVPGGVRPDGVALWLRDMPTYTPGARVLFFLRPGKDGVLRPTDLLLGTFAVRTHLGRDVVFRPPSLSHADPPGVGPIRDLGRFGRWLRDRAGAHRRAPDYDSGLALADVLGTVPSKFVLLHSPTSPPPLGCGADGGYPIRWFDFDDGGSVAWRRDPAGLPGFVDGGLEAFAAARAAWNDAVESIQLDDAGTTTASGGLLVDDGVSTVLFDDPNDELPGTFGGSGLLALGGAWFRCDDKMRHAGVEYHVAFEGDIVVQDGIETFFQASSDPAAAAAELFGHELGHTLGLDHSLLDEALMYATVHDDGRGAALSQDDETAATVLYKLSSGPSMPLPPDAPTDLEVTLIGNRTAELTWTPVGGGVRIERRLGDGPLLGVASVGDEGRWVDSGLLGGVTYAYRIQIFDPFGASDWSAEMEVTTGGSLEPTAPSNLRLAPLSATSIRLTWQDNSEDEIFFRVDQRIGNAWHETAVVLLPDTTSVTLSGLAGGVAYTFRVRAEGVGGSSPPTNVATTRTFPPGAACSSTDTRLCLLDGRYAVEVRWRNQHDGGSEGVGRMIPVTNKTGQVWFFNPNNVELIVKILDGTSVNGNVWTFYGGLSDVEYWVTVTDTENGEVREYRNPPGELCGIADTTAFTPSGPSTPVDLPDLALPVGPLFAEADAPTAPVVRPAVAGTPGQLPPCVSDLETLCLLDDRFTITVAFQNQHAGGASGVGKAIAGSDRTGSMWFFNLENTELVIKILDGRPANGHFWLAYGALSDVEYTITATDTVTGIVRRYENPPGEICGIADTRAFPEPEPEPPAPPASPGLPVL